MAEIITHNLKPFPPFILAFLREVTFIRERYYLSLWSFVGHDLKWFPLLQTSPAHPLMYPTNLAPSPKCVYAPPLQWIPIELKKTSVSCLSTKMILNCVWYIDYASSSSSIHCSFREGTIATNSYAYSSNPESPTPVGIQSVLAFCLIGGTLLTHERGGIIECLKDNTQQYWKTCITHIHIPPPFKSQMDLIEIGLDFYIASAWQTISSLLFSYISLWMLSNLFKCLDFSEANLHADENVGY